MNTLESNLNKAILICKGHSSQDDYFDRIYSFATENISQYINEFSLNNRSLLTVGSSGDQVINSSLYGCTNQTVCDVCSFAKYYFYLKKAGILSLTYSEFLNYFCYFDYPQQDSYNKNVFNQQAYQKIKTILKSLDNESLWFWDELFKQFDGEQVREQLFVSDEIELMTLLKEYNIYLKNATLFEKTKKTIAKVNPQFITQNIYGFNPQNTFDNIFLSNLIDYSNLNDYIDFINRLSTSLNVDGAMLIAYLFRSKINNQSHSYLDLDQINSAFNKDSIITKSFDSPLPGYKKDSVLIYKK